ncbi:lipopolysaccharide heptosyltransferase II [Massilia sp. PAMC28688]|uniref:lipopolysaccharide heptosyltransferase II n=1 Tax=Massilia sp. PAMC28688 TaxID=2861283 RepID=UPI001C63864E|nr:lipopolysaccharide heptosyltransferase II [Massilia sp. PAMC28688]QYF91764.1 lipopolysaccharide heptosyltransferase II [Massilia sp. PAMC28688]
MMRTLVISPNWIGDAVMAQPLLQLLKRAHPDRAIDVLAPPSVAPVWRAMREVDSVLETPFRHGALQLRERWKYAQLLRTKGYADAYVLPNTLKYALIPWMARIPVRVGYKGEMRHGLINRMHHDDQPKRPMVPFYAALAAAPGPAPVSPPRPAMEVGDSRSAAVCAAHGVDPAQSIVVFAPGAEFGAAKRWPARHFAALAQEVLAVSPGAQVVLLGSPKDREACEEIIALTGPAHMFNLAGATKLDEAIAVIARAATVVANDSGLLHIASALNRPVMALYGPTDPDHAPPFSDIARSFSLRLACSPCRQRECPLGHHDCMEKMDAGVVWRELRPVLTPL